MLVIIEPGTPSGFERIRILRKQMIDIGGYIAAPCPHQKECPMPTNDWCHFSARLERSTAHRFVKEGALGYEDEKFSYIAVTKEVYPQQGVRVLRHPLKHPGSITLTLCEKDTIHVRKVTKKRKESYKKARKLAWGDWVEHLDN